MGISDNELAMNHVLGKRAFEMIEDHPSFWFDISLQDSDGKISYEEFRDLVLRKQIHSKVAVKLTIPKEHV